MKLVEEFVDKYLSGNHAAIKDIYILVDKLDTASKLRRKVEALEKYKTHFDAEFVLRHGKPAEGIQI